MRPNHLTTWLAVLAVTGVSLALPGCVRRRMTIHSNPPGAQVYVDNYEIGTTPCSTEFTYYGTREIRLIKDGYETLTVYQPMQTPWYEVPPLDFFSENVVPAEYRDERTLSYNLAPQVVVPTNQLMGRAEDLRRSAQAPPGAPLAGPVQFAAPPSHVPQPFPAVDDRTSQPIPLPQTLPPGGQPPVYAPPRP